MLDFASLSLNMQEPTAGPEPSVAAGQTVAVPQQHARTAVGVNHDGLHGLAIEPGPADL